MTTETPQMSHQPAPDPGSSRRSRSPRWWIAGIAISAVVVVVAALFASGDPDGLERVAEDQGIIGRAQDALYSILPDYSIPGIDDPAVSTILSGLVGVAIVFGLMWLLGRMLARRRTSGAPH
jgi:hypothetical protein